MEGSGGGRDRQGGCGTRLHRRTREGGGALDAEGRHQRATVGGVKVLTLALVLRSGAAACPPCMRPRQGLLFSKKSKRGGAKGGTPAPSFECLGRPGRRAFDRGDPAGERAIGSRRARRRA